MTESYSVLVVEDDSDHQLLIQRMLRKRSDLFPIVEIAHDAIEAQRFVNQMEFDCFLVDNQLPAENGLELITNLQAQGISGPFVLMTSAGTEELVVQAYRNNVSDYLTKDVGFWKDLPSMLVEVMKANALEKAESSRVEELERVNEGLDEVNTEVQVQYDAMKKERSTTSKLLAGATEELADVINAVKDKATKRRLEKVYATLVKATKAPD